MRARRTALLILLVSTFAIAQANFTYKFRSLPAVGSMVTEGDFDKNGWPDIAVASNQGPGEFVSIFPNSAGNLGTRRDYPLSEAGVLATADVNNDGWLDIAVAQFNSQSVLLLMNNGNGTFHSGNIIPAGMQAFDVQFADLNNDKNIDLIVPGIDGSSVFRIFLGNGTGTFLKKTDVASGSGSFAITDLNRDGKLDIVRTAFEKVWLSFGNGDGTFRGTRSFSVPDRDGANTITVADFNNDSKHDLAVLSPHSCGSACGDNTVYIYQGDGAGNFALHSSFRIGSSGFGELYIADVNGDLNEDIVARNADHFGGFLAYALGHGNGFFDHVTDLPASEVSDFLERDWNRDSRHDIAWSSWLGEELIIGTNNNAFTNCAPPSSAKLAAKICGPSANATVSGSTLLKASGNSPAGIKRLEVWIDGVKKYQKWHDQINRRLSRFSLSPGRHRIAVVAVDKNVGSSSTVMYVNLQ